MRTKLLTAAAVLMGYVVPALATATAAPKMFVVKALVNEQGQEVSATVTPIDFDRVVADAATAQEANAVAEKTGVALALDNDEGTVTDNRGGWAGRRFFNYGHYYRYPHYNYYRPNYYPYYNYSYYSYPYNYYYYYNPNYYGWRW